MSAPSTADPQSAKTGGLKLTARDRRILGDTFSIDTRAMAVVRILLAALILFESLFVELDRARDPAGLADLLGQYGDVLVIPFAVMMLFGFKTRWAVALTWLTYSAPLRAGLLADVGVSMGKLILSLALFWCIFLPLGRHLSLDARESSIRPARFLSVAGGALLFQIFLIYFSAGVTKDWSEWITDRTAMETILSHPRYLTPVGEMLLDFPAVLGVMSLATIIVEVFGALLVIVPGKTLEKRRMVMVPLFILFHIGISVLMGIGLFPYVMVAIWLLFLPARFWDRVWARFGGETAPTEPEREASSLRNRVAGVAVVLAAVSNMFTWLYFPNYEGFVGIYQTAMYYLMIYQQWLMFHLPSAIPV